MMRNVHLGTTRANIVQLDYVGSLNALQYIQMQIVHDTSDKLAAECLNVLKMPELQIV